jgi:hypothetical protein
MKSTEVHVLERSREILEDARRLGYFRFKCGIEREGLCALKLSFGKGGSIYYVRQLGWARFLNESGGFFAGYEQAVHLKGIVETFILSADGIEPWTR